MTKGDASEIRLRRWRRWCLFGWAVAAFMTVTAVVAAEVLCGALRTESALTDEAQRLAQQHLLDLASTRLHLRTAEHRLVELGDTPQPDIDEVTPNCRTAR